MSLVVDLTLYSFCLPRLEFAAQVIFAMSVSGGSNAVRALLEVLLNLRMSRKSSRTLVKRFSFQAYSTPDLIAWISVLEALRISTRPILS